MIAKRHVFGERPTSGVPKSLRRQRAKEAGVWAKPRQVCEPRIALEHHIDRGALSRRAAAEHTDRLHQVCRKAAHEETQAVLYADWIAKRTDTVQSLGGTLTTVVSEQVKPTINNTEQPSCSFPVENVTDVLLRLSGDGSSDKPHSTALVLGCIDALLLKLDCRFSAEVAVDPKLHRALAAVSEACSAHLVSTEQSRKDLLTQLEVCREELQKAEARYEKLQTAGKGVSARTCKYMLETEALESEVAVGRAERQALQQRLDAALEEQSSLRSSLEAEHRKVEDKWLAEREKLVGERDRLREEVSDLSGRVDVAETQLRELEHEAATITDQCIFAAERLQEQPELELRLTQMQDERADLLVLVRQKQSSLRRRRPRTVSPIPKTY
eukprot:TRINITY_DN21953_c0_g4_i1.p1 TRINITY_DN21953_c0_g4~~TRINITY_DN21953_c0_g4_i1.p1  ORF type:complete len:384 (+),score=104.32 TRINITY_DN21953_c0_g4_i1:137-1288(+)